MVLWRNNVAEVWEQFHRKQLLLSLVLWIYEIETNDWNWWKRGIYETYKMRESFIEAI